MNQYTKPTLSLLTVATNTGSASSCKTGTVEAKEVLEMFEIMGVPKDSAFNSSEGCSFPVDGVDSAFSSYCKFSGAVQVFYS